MTEVRISVLGPTRVTLDGAGVTVRSALARRLLAALVLHRPSGASLDRLADDLWRDDLPRNPAGALANHVARLRAALGDAVIEGFPGGYRLGPVVCDVDELEVVVADGMGDPERRSAISELVRGVAYADLDSADARAESARLEELYVAALETAAEAQLRDGNPTQAATAARVLIEQHPLRERPRLVHAEALAAIGRIPEGLRSLADLRRVLLDELGIDPSPAAGALERRLLEASTPSLCRQPIHVIGPLVGRDALLDQLADLRRDHRLVTLVGPGGVGKTALLRAVSAREPGGVVGFVELTAARDDTDVAALVATRLGIDRTGTESWASRIVAALTFEAGLVVLDNAEHVLDGVGALVSELLRSTPVHLAVSSRVPLSLPGERMVTVPPLEVADDARSAALALFTISACRVRDRWEPEPADTDTIVRICRQVDGLPLGIELAAAQLRYRSLGEIAERLDRSLDALDRTRHGEGRHGGLRAALDWSWRLLDERDRLVLSQVACFVGGFDRPAAVTACSDIADPALVEASLDRLLDASLLTHSDRSYGTRYTALDTVRRYALDHLETADAKRQSRDRHAQAIVGLVDRCATDVFGPSERESVDRLTDARPDVLAAFDHLTDRGAAHDALRLAVGAYLVALPRRHADLADLPAKAIACYDEQASAQRSGPLLVEALGIAADAATLAGAHDEARTLIERARHENADDTAMRYYRAVEADLALYVGDVDAATEHYLAASDGFAGSGQAALAEWMHASAALARSYDAHPDDQVGAARDALERAERIGCSSTVAFCRYVYAEVIRRRDGLEARRHLELAVGEATGVDAEFVAGLTRLSLATAATERGELSAGATQLRSLLDLWSRLGNGTQQWITVRAAAILLARAGRHRDALVAIASARHHAPVDAWGEDDERVAASSIAAEHALDSEGLREVSDLARAMTLSDVVQHLHLALSEVADDRDPLHTSDERARHAR